MCSDLDLGPYLKGQGHTFKGQSTHARVQSITYLYIEALVRI